MICPQCGAMVDDSLLKCDNCSYEFVSESPATSADTEYVSNVPAVGDEFSSHDTFEKKPIKKPNVYKLVMLVIAIAVAFVSIYGAYYIIKAGINLNAIEAPITSLFDFGSTNNTQTVYYQNLGAVYYGIGYAIGALGSGVAGIILAIAYKK